MLSSCPPEKKKRVEKNKRTNAKRDPEKRNPHFSLTVEVKRGDEGRLSALRSRLQNAKVLLGIERATSSTQNADILEALLSFFESTTQPTKPLASHLSPATSTNSMPSDPQSPNQSSVHRRPQKRQIYVDATVDDPCFVCTGESLKSLVKYFAENPQCEFCGENYKWSGMNFSRQSHACRMEVPCICEDSTVWLSSGVLGHPAKYFVNVR